MASEVEAGVWQIVDSLFLKVLTSFRHPFLIRIMVLSILLQIETIKVENIV